MSLPFRCSLHPLCSPALSAASFPISVDGSHSGVCINGIIEYVLFLLAPGSFIQHDFKNRPLLCMSVVAPLVLSSIYCTDGPCFVPASPCGLTFELLQFSALGKDAKGLHVQIALQTCFVLAQVIIWETCEGPVALLPHPCLAWLVMLDVSHSDRV